MDLCQLYSLSLIPVLIFEELSLFVLNPLNLVLSNFHFDFVNVPVWLIIVLRCNALIVLLTVKWLSKSFYFLKIVIVSDAHLVFHKILGLSNVADSLIHWHLFIQDVLVDLVNWMKHHSVLFYACLLVEEKVERFCCLTLLSC